MLLVYITCKNKKEAQKIGLALLKKRLVGCSLVIPHATSFYWWPPKKNKIEKSREAVLLVKTLEKKFPRLEREAKKLHSYTVPCILALPVAKINKDYLVWLRKEI
ncbi:MAG: divalent-cation tolerance protein CutA [Candidatus Sungiibacteriota bacterium]|uniref:Divalent-cation tolerance protein CutA n=1 Tax=Candidatus Sungiibacteriota bacterium TaxID=2750080 RepID=A0A7T5RJ54_9BACT|nr:MAG: divalent-cation tolerance protein CutA [Candidatus Sungbacteria bacterium]